MNFEVKIYKTGLGLFQTKYLDPKTGRRRRKRFQTLKEAKLYKSDVESRLQRVGLSAFTDLRVAQAMKQFLERFPNANIRERKNHFKGFIDRFGEHRVSELNTNDLLEWFGERKSEGNLSERTMGCVRSQFFGFFEFLVDQDFIRGNPLKKVKFKRFDNPRRPRVVLAKDEVLEILENAKIFSPKVLLPYLFTLAHTGSRRSEVLTLRRIDVDFKTGLIHFRQTKNGHERFVRMAPSLTRLLLSHLESHNCDNIMINKEGTRLQHSELSKSIIKFKHYFPMDKNWGCHSFRHSFAYNFLKMGGQMYQLQAILGHRGIQTTVDLYGQLQAQDVENPSPYEY